MLILVKFRNIELLPTRQDTVIEAAAIAVYPYATLYISVRPPLDVAHQTEKTPKGIWTA